MHVRLDELYEVIKRLMDATFEATDTEMRVRLAHLEYRARQYLRLSTHNNPARDGVELTKQWGLMRVR